MEYGDEKVEARPGYLGRAFFRSHEQRELIIGDKPVLDLNRAGIESSRVALGVERVDLDTRPTP